MTCIKDNDESSRLVSFGKDLSKLISSQCKSYNDDFINYLFLAR